MVGRYARIIMDYWFKRTFGEEPRKRLLQLFLEELIPERKIENLTYVCRTGQSHAVCGKTGVSPVVRLIPVRSRF